MPVVAVTQDLYNIERAIAEALGHMPLDSLVRGRLVAVKPNDTWASADDTTGVTQADTLRPVLRELKRFCPRELADYYGHPRATEKQRHCFFDDLHSFIARWPGASESTSRSPSAIRR